MDELSQPKKQITNNNHFLPQCYLINFEDKNQKDSNKKLGVYVKNYDKYRTSHAAKEMYEKKLYHNHIEGRDQNEYEDWLQTIEDKAGPILNRINLKEEIADEDIFWISQFISVQLSRTPTYINNAIEDADRFETQKLLEFEKEKGLSPAISDIINYKDYALKLIKITADRLLKFLSDENFYYEIHYTAYPLIIGDSPVLQFEKENLLSGESLELAMDLLVLPLSRYSYIVFGKKKDADKNYVTQNINTYLINQCIIRAAEKRIIFHPDDKNYVQCMVLRTNKEFPKREFAVPSIVTYLGIEFKAYPIETIVNEHNESISKEFFTTPPAFKKRGEILINKATAIREYNKSNKNLNETIEVIAEMYGIKEDGKYNLRKFIEDVIEEHKTKPFDLS